MKANYKEFRTISSDRVRMLCCERNYYTLGCSEDYEHLLCVLCDSEINQTLDRIYNIADDIIRHSDVEYQDEHVDVVMWALINECCTTFIKRG